MQLVTTDTNSSVPTTMLIHPAVACAVLGTEAPVLQKCHLFPCLLRRAGSDTAQDSVQRIVIAQTVVSCYIIYDPSSAKCSLLKPLFQPDAQLLLAHSLPRIFGTILTAC